MVDAVGDGVEDLEVGARVVFVSKFGGHSDTVVVARYMLAPIPDELGFEDAAAMPVNRAMARISSRRVTPVRRLSTSHLALITGRFGHLCAEGHGGFSGVGVSVTVGVTVTSGVDVGVPGPPVGVSSKIITAPPPSWPPVGKSFQHRSVTYTLSLLGLAATSNGFPY